VQLHRLVDQLVADTLGSLWPPFAPEIILCATIFVMLMVRVFEWGKRIDPFLLALAGSALALYFGDPWQHLGDPVGLPRYELFTGMLVYDKFSIFLRALLLLFALLFAVLTRISGIPARDDRCDFYCLVLGATLGMCLMVSANHLLMVFLAVEMASVPSYALAGLLRERRNSSEAALKYSVYGAGAAGIMLYGISLMAGLLNTAHLPTLAHQLAAQLPGMPGEQKLVLVLGGLMVMAGLAFKLSAVPFHFWCPDVFEGASAEVNAFLSVASKAAAMGLLVRVVIGFGVVPAGASQPPPVSADFAAAPAAGGWFAVADEVAADKAAAADDEDDPTAADRHRAAAAGLPAEPPAADKPAATRTRTAMNRALAPVREFVALLVAIVAALTCTFGNLAAYGQTNIKRLMAYSTIAHAGYMMLAVPAALAMAGVSDRGAQRAIAALALYLGVYLFMNLGAFAIVAFLRNQTGSEEIADYSGLVRRSPGIVLCLAVILFSLVGLPPLAGFVGKFAIFASLVEAYRVTGHSYPIVLLVVGGLNTALSLFYYLRVVKVMTIDPEAERAAAQPFSLVSLPGAYVVAVTLPTILLFVNWDLLNSWTLAATSRLF